MTARKRVLIVEDHEPTRSLIRSILQAQGNGGFEIFEAANGSEGLLAAEKNGPLDLILLDVEMDDMDGYSVCRAIRRLDGDVPIVFVTAHGEVKDRTNGRHAGGDSYLVKPVDRKQLMTLVNLLTNMERRFPRSASAR
jgi:two-component system response regulator ResD